MVAFSLAGLLFALFYIVWFLVAYDEPQWPMVLVSVGTATFFASGLLIARTRYTTQGSFVIVTLAMLVLLVYTAALSTASDVHMLYLAAGFAMLALFPEHLLKARIGYATVIVALVIACEFVFPASSAVSEAEAARNDLAASANRMWTVMIVAMAMAIVLYRNTRQHRDLSGAAELGEYRANTDPMTGIANRRPVLARLREHDGQGGGGYAIALVDIDSFKMINDRLGHEDGDVLISAIANRLRGHFRQTDVVSRWGGDEFLVLLSLVEPGELFSVLDRLRESVARSPFSLGAEPIAVTLSIGAAMALKGDSSRDTINAADQALYTAKHSGRNTVVLGPSGVTEKA
jgi:diguanylate cyclase (GGDEF)-like protein